MQQVQLNRQRNGAYGWSIARDITDPELWTERYHCPTWHDYLRQRSRPTDAERALQRTATDMHHRARSGPHPPDARAAVRLSALEGGHAGCGTGDAIQTAAQNSPTSRTSSLAQERKTARENNRWEQNT